MCCLLLQRNIHGAIFIKSHSMSMSLQKMDISIKPPPPPSSIVMKGGMGLLYPLLLSTPPRLAETAN